MVTTISGFPYRVGPINNVTPFTYRDGTTYLEQLDNLTRYVTSEIHPAFNSAIQDVVNELNSSLDGIQNYVIESKAEYEELNSTFISRLNERVAETESSVRDSIERLDNSYTEFTADTTNLISSINDRVGPPPIQRVILNSTTGTISIPAEFPPNQPIHFVLKQSTPGNFSPTFANNIFGAVRVNPVSNSETSVVVYPNGDGTWTAKQDITRVMVDEFRRPNDSSDNQAIERAVAVAAPFGATVVFTSGTVYTITSMLYFSGVNVRLESSGSTPAVIHQNGNTFNSLWIEASLTTVPAEKILAKSMTINTNGWTLNNTTGITPGMLCRVMSTKSWYYDPRPTEGDARKSELHRVTSVDANTVWFEDAANDGYDLTKESVTLTFFNPISVSISNITFRGVHEPYSVSASAKTGIHIEGAYEPIINNVNVENMSYTGINFRYCYRSVVDGGHTYGANAVPTGYGVSHNGCAHSTVRNRSFWGCRRGVDFSGANIISRHNLVEGCKNYGGGRQLDGQYYGWGPNASLGIQNYGFGSHGPADHSIYRNNVTANLHMPYNLRGGDEIIENATHYGRTRNGVVAAITGSGLTINGITVRAGVSTTTDKESGIFDTGGNMSTRRADCLVMFFDEYDFAKSKISIRNVEAEIQNRLVEFPPNKAPTLFFYMGDIRVMFGTQNSNDPRAVIWHAGETVLKPAAYRYAFGMINYVNESGTATPTLTRNLDVSGARMIDYAFITA